MASANTGIGDANGRLMPAIGSCSIIVVILNGLAKTLKDARSKQDQKSIVSPEPMS